MLSSGNDSMEGLGLSQYGGLGITTSPDESSSSAALRGYVDSANNSSIILRKHVIDASEGANYSGGSSYAPGLPLGPSSWGLAGTVDGLAASLGRHGLVALDSELLVNYAPQEDLSLLPLPVTARSSRRKPARDAFAMVETVTDGLSELAAEGRLHSSEGDLKQVLAASLKPGSADAGKIARALAEKSLVLGQQAMRRGKATEQARREVKRLKGEVDALETKVKDVARKIFSEDANGNLTVSREANKADVRKFEKLRQKQLMLARRAVRFEKVNAVGTALAQNAASQAALTQQIAATVLTGQPAAAAVLGKMYNQLGKSSAKLRDIREKQVENSTQRHQKDVLHALLTRKAELLRQTSALDVMLSRPGVEDRALLLKKFETLSGEVQKINGELVKMQAQNRGLGVAPGFDGFEAVLDSLDNELRMLSQVLNSNGELAYDFGGFAAVYNSPAEYWWNEREKFKPANKGLNVDSWWSKAGVDARKTMRAIFDNTPAEWTLKQRLDWWESIGKNKRQKLRGNVGLIDSIGKVAGGAVKAVGNVAGKVVKVAGSVAKAPIKIIPIKSVRKALNSAIDTVHKVAGKVFVDLPCKLATSAVGRTATQIGGTAVGTVYGGPAGGAVGSVAANRANDLNKTLCGGLKKLGLTEGKFRTSKLGSTLASTAGKIIKQSTNPKNALRDAMAAGTAYMGGGGASPLLSSFGGGAISNLGLNNLVGQFGAKAANMVGGNVASQFVNQAGGMLGKQVMNQVQGQITNFAQKQAMNAAQGLVRQVAGPQAAQLFRTASPYMMQGGGMPGGSAMPQFYPQMQQFFPQMQQQMPYGQMLPQMPYGRLF